MTNNISGKDRDFGQLLDSVKQDTPDISNDELLSLITKSEERSGAVTMRQNTQRKNKRVAVMSIIAAIALVASYLIFSSPQQSRTSILTKDRSRNAAIASRDQVKVDPTSSTATWEEEQRTTTVAIKPTTDPNIVDPKRWEMFIHKPIDLQAYIPLEISEEKLAGLGLLRTDSGEVLYYHKNYKFGFPMFEYIRQFNDSKDPDLKILGNRPFYAQYVTDSRGNMMMHYENRKINGGTSVMIGMYDRDLSELLKTLKYYGNSNVKSDEIFADTVKKVYRRSLVIRQGIMICDTVLEGVIGDDKIYQSRIDKILSKLRAEDSTYKMSLGGMDAIARDYVFDMSATNEPLVQRVIASFAIIDQTKKSEIEKLSDKINDVERLMIGEKSVAWRLRLEQLSIKLQYDAYIEQSKLEAAELANPIDLVAVKVRESSGLKANPKLDNGLIFWYRDSDSLRDVLGGASKVKLESNPKLKLSVMPNPAMLYLYVNYDLNEAGPLRLTLADITGKQVYTDVWKAQAGSGKREINVQQIPAGIYILILDSERGRTTRQVIIQHQ